MTDKETDKETDKWAGYCAYCWEYGQATDKETDMPPHALGAARRRRLELLHHPLRA